MFKRNYLMAALMLAVSLALAGCGGGSNNGPTEAEKMVEAAMESAKNAIDAANMAANALTPSSDDAAVAAAEGQVLAAETAITNLPESSQEEYTAMLNSAASTVAAHRARLTAESGQQDAEKARDDAVDELDNKNKADADAAKDKMDKERKELAAKLYAGIYAPAADATGIAVGNVHAAYNDAGTPAGSTADTHIIVTIGDGTAANGQALSEDKDATVAANRGWTGKKYTYTDDDDNMYEAVVYSNVEERKPGKKFGSVVSGSTAAPGYEYALSSVHGGYNLINPTPAGDSDKVVLTEVTRTAGVETWTFADQTPNPDASGLVTTPGSYHGVPGEYRCLATPNLACTATVASGGGFILRSQSNWWFIPANGENRVMGAADTAYASYGWWLHTDAEGNMTASAFDDFKGTVEPAVALPVTGTATYVGGAAGKYALASPTGGTNDAGHFTARATLEAEFAASDASTISGTIDMFMGADGEERDWSVALKEAISTQAGVITRAGTDQLDNDTAWTIGETAASASGEWSGGFHEQGADSVPHVVTGTFYTEYGTAGKMVGAFGANCGETCGE